MTKCISYLHYGQNLWYGKNTKSWCRNEKVQLMGNLQSCGEQFFEPYNVCKRRTIALCFAVKNEQRKDMSNRPSIPLPLKRRVLIEAGHRCAIPACKHPDVEICHIIPWAEVKEHTFENLIALCPNCHSRCREDNEPGQSHEIDRKSQFEYKKKLQDSALPSGSIWQIPFPKNVFFTGRNELLEEIEKKFSSTGNQYEERILPIVGLGGVGKTQLAIEYAYKSSDAYTYAFWVDAETENSLREGVASIGTSLGFADEDVSVLLKKVNSWLCANENWLLIFDNADTLDILKAFIPLNPAGDILITSRSQSLDSISIKDVIILNPLSKDESINFLKKRANLTVNTEEEQEAMLTLVEELGNLPLALEQAGAYIYRTKATPQMYLKAYQKLKIELLEKSPPVLGDTRRTVETTWLLNFNQVCETSESSKAALYLCAFLYPIEIPVFIFSEGMKYLIDSESNIADKELWAHETLEPLYKLSLISYQNDLKSFDIHRLTQEVLKTQLADERDIWKNKIVEILANIFPSAGPGNWEKGEALLPHIKNFITTDLSNDFNSANFIRLLVEVGLYLAQRGKYEIAIDLYERAEKLANEYPVKDEIDYYGLHNNFGFAHSHLHNFEEAERHFKKALDASERTPAQKCCILNNMAATYRLEGRLKEAESAYQEALSLVENIENETERDLDKAQLYSGYAYILQSKDRFEEAIELINKTIAIRERFLPNTILDLAHNYNSLGFIYHVKRDLDLADKYYDQAVGVGAKYGLNPRYLAGYMDNSATLDIERGRYKIAESKLVAAIEMLEALFGPEHPSLLPLLTRLVLALEEGRRGAAAKVARKRIKTIQENPNYPYPIVLDGN